VEAALDEVVQVFASIGEGAVMRKLFEELFTDSERKDVALRWELMKMIQADVPQREIAAELGISLCKITRGSRVLREPGSVAASILSDRSDDE